MWYDNYYRNDCTKFTGQYGKGVFNRSTFERWQQREFLPSMDHRLFETLCTIYEKHAGSMLGAFIGEAFSNNKDKDPLIIIRQKLLSKDFNTLDDFLEVSGKILHKTALAFGEHSELSCIILQFLEFLKDDVMRARGSKREELIDQFYTLIEKTRAVALGLSDNFEEFEEEVNTRIETISQYIPQQPPRMRGRKVDLQRLYQAIGALKSDDENAAIIDIVTRYNNTYVYTDDVIEFNLEDINEYTQTLIEDYVAKRVNLAEIKPLTPTEGDKEEQPTTS